MLFAADAGAVREAETTVRKAGALDRQACELTPGVAIAGTGQCLQMLLTKRSQGIVVGMLVGRKIAKC